MRILIADDDPVSRRLIERAVAGRGAEVRLARDGAAAWEELRQADGPALAILDWVMPGLDGPGVCRRVHALGRAPRPYLILLTSQQGKEHLLAGLGSGADDYLTKPFDADELRARVSVGLRVLELQRGLGQRIQELESALAQIKHLQGLLPICMYCKKIRVDPNYWQQVESYIAHHTAARFSHGICPDCLKDVIQAEADRQRVRLSTCPGEHPAPAVAE